MAGKFRNSGPLIIFEMAVFGCILLWLILTLLPQALV